MKTFTLLLFLFVATIANGQIKIEDDQFTYKETQFHVEDFEILDCGTTMIHCYWVNPDTKEKEKYTFFIDRKCKVLAFYDVKYGTMHDQR